MILMDFYELPMSPPAQFNYAFIDFEARIQQWYETQQDLRKVQDLHHFHHHEFFLAAQIPRKRGSGMLSNHLQIPTPIRFKSSQNQSHERNF